MPYKDRKKRRENDRRYRAKNPAKVKAMRLKYNSANRERIKGYYIKNKIIKQEQRLMRKYGITFEERKALLIAQVYSCAGCGIEEDEKIKLHIDHNHITGRVRGLLCRDCNTALGILKEDSETLQNLITYLGIHVGSKH